MRLTNTVYLNRIPQSYDILSDFEKARLYHLKHGVEWENIFKNVSVAGYISTFDTYINKWLIRGTEKLITLENTDVNTFVFDMAEWATLQGSPFPLKFNTPNGCAYLVGNKPYTVIGAYLAEHLSGQTWIQIAHEKMHDLVKIANLNGFYVPDVMDSYRENANPDSETGNFAQQWSLLKPFLDSQNPVVITRKFDDGVQTLGDLDYGHFKCKTLERPWKGNKPNISCIPKGTYKCVYTFSPKFMKYTYEIKNVIGRSGIRIHSANYFFDLLGCIALGSGYENLNNDKQVDIINSRLTVNKLEAILNKKDFTLIIK